jgi:hypothetical protein
MKRLCHKNRGNFVPHSRQRLLFFECFGNATMKNFRQQCRGSQIVLALWLTNPHGRTISAISPSDSCDIAQSLSTKLNSLFVTIFATKCMHCADSMTAISRVYGSLWKSGICNFGDKRSDGFELQIANCLGAENFGKSDKIDKFAKIKPAKRAVLTKYPRNLFWHGGWRSR